MFKYCLLMYFFYLLKELKAATLQPCQWIWYWATSFSNANVRLATIALSSHRLSPACVISSSEDESY